MAANPYPRTPTPAGALDVDEWVAADPLPYRHFVGTRRPVKRHVAADVNVVIRGFQRPDGRCERHVVVSTNQDGALTYMEARQLALALSAAADEVQQMNERDYGGESR